MRTFHRFMNPSKAFQTLFSALLCVSFIASPSAQAAFSDTVENPHSNAIDYLELQGAVRDAENFRPNDALTRAELVTILSRLLLIPDEEHSVQLNDVPDSTWFENSAEWAVEKNWLSAPNQEFQPEKTVTRIDALAILLKAYGHGPRVILAQNRDRLFRDVSATHPDYELVARGVELGVLDAHQAQLFRPHSKITRGEWADFLYKMEAHDLLGDAPNFYNSDIFTSIWNLIEQNFYSVKGNEISEEALFQGAIKGILTVLNDPYTVYFDPAAGPDFLDALNGKVFGVGMVLKLDNDGQKILIESVLNDSPAKEAQIQAGDEILEVDGVSVAGLSIEAVAQKIRGEEGTEVTLTLSSNGVHKTLILTRRAVQNDAVEFDVENHLWVIHLSMFSDQADEEFDVALQSLASEEPNPKGLILDLRENRGGYLSTAEAIAGHFLEKNAVLYQLKTVDVQIPIENQNTPDHLKLPSVIWVNQNSASASEVLTAAFQDWDRATVLGQQSFGKGTAQSIQQFWDGSLIKITVAEWLSPKGRSIQTVGVTPDIEIKTTASEAEWMEKSVEAL